MFLLGHFKLSTLQQGGDSGSAPRELGKDEQEVAREHESKPYGSNG